MRGNQARYNQILQALPRGMRYVDMVQELVGMGYRPEQAKSAVYNFQKEWPVRADRRISSDEADTAIMTMGGLHRRSVDLINDLVEDYSYSLGQAKGHVYTFRKRHGLA